MNEPGSKLLLRGAGALGAGALAGGILGLADSLLTLGFEQRSMGAGELLRVAALLLIANLSVCVILALLLAPFLARVGNWLSNHRTLWVGALVVAVCALTFDKWFFVHRYPYFHSLLALGFSCLAVTAASGFGTGSRAPLLGLAATLPILSGPVLGPALSGESHVVRQVMASGSTVGGWMWTLWAPSAEEAELGDCEWPSPQRVPPADPPVFAERPNILLLSVDAVRGDLGGPGLDRYWPEIMTALPGAHRFDLAYAAGTRTTESLFSMLTGRWPHTLEFRPSIVERDDRGEDSFRILPDDDPRLLDPQSWRQHHPLPIADQNPTLPGALRSNGYHTVAAAASLFFLRGAGISKDFEIVDSTAYRRVESGEIESEGFSSAELTDTLLRQLESAPAGKPWFAWAHYLDSHAPYRAVSLHEQAKGAGKGPPSNLERYLITLRRADRQIGRLLSGLAARGQLENTIVIVTSDHGEEFRDHGGQYHGTTVYEELLHVPLLVHLPGHRGRPVGTRVSLIDLFPTLVELLSLELETTFDGRSLAPILIPGSEGGASAGALATSKRPILGVATLHGRKAAALLGPYKLIENPDLGSTELYNLSVDPQERRNVAQESPRVLRHLRCLVAKSGVLETPPVPTAGSD